MQRPCPRPIPQTGRAPLRAIAAAPVPSPMPQRDVSRRPSSAKRRPPRAARHAPLAKAPLAKRTR